MNERIKKLEMEKEQTQQDQTNQQKGELNYQGQRHFRCRFARGENHLGGRGYYQQSRPQVDQHLSLCLKMINA